MDGILKIIEKQSKIQFDVDFKKETGEELTTCPSCSHTRKKDKVKCLGWNHNLGAGKCNHCEAIFYIEKEKSERFMKQDYKKPLPLATGLTEKAQEYIISRGLSTNTILRFGIAESIQFMPQKQDKSRCIAFPYYRKDELVNVKYRDREKNFKMESGAELILFNYDAGIGTDELYITEGEFDCMALYEAGIYNVVSVPDGAKKTENAKLDWITNSWEILDKKKKIILCFDTDEAGLAFREVVANRLGKDICHYVDFLEYKDANEVLLSNHPEYLKQLCLAYNSFPLEGIETVENLESSLNNIYHNGYPTADKLGYDNFDKLISFPSKALCVITGIPSHGKSEFLDQVIIRLSKNYGRKGGIFSAENQPTELHMIKLSEKLADSRITEKKYTHNDGSETVIPKMTFDKFQEAKKFINDHYYFIKITAENSTVEALILKAKELKARYGINFFIIDNWAKLKGNSRDLEMLNEKINMLSELTRTHDLIIFIVAHPTKMLKDKNTGAFEVPNLYNVSGTSDWYNLADIGITVYRDFKANLTDVYINKIRWGFLGQVGCQSFEWQPKSGGYIEWDGAKM